MTIQLMVCPRTTEQRIDALRYGVGAQSSRFWNGTRQQAHAADQDKLAPVLHREGIAEHPAHILDADHLCCEDIWNANRIDKVGHVGSHLLHAESPWCAGELRESIAHTSSSNNPINIWTPSISGVRQIGAAS